MGVRGMGAGVDKWMVDISSMLLPHSVRLLAWWAERACARLMVYAGVCARAWLLSCVCVCVPARLYAWCVLGA